MHAIALARRISAGDRFEELTTRHGPGHDRYFRIFGRDGPRLLKVYGSRARERRERRALEALAAIPGLPEVIARGAEDDPAWALFADPGAWTLGALPESLSLARRAGEILRAVHDAPSEGMTNLARGIDQEWVAIDRLGTLRRLKRYRRRLGISGDLLEAAGRVRPPFCSPPRPAHTDPRPERFFVDEGARVTLMDWEWSTLAPPEWDLSKAVWSVGVAAGPAAAEALQDGYGRALDPEQLDRWIVYHAVMGLVYLVEAERHLHDPIDDLVAQLHRAVAAAG